MGENKPQTGTDQCLQTLYTLGFILLLIMGVIYFNPSPIDPQPYHLGSYPSVQLSNHINMAEVIFRQRRLLKGPESIAIDGNTNLLYTGTQDGKILRANLDKPYSSAPQMVGVIGNPSQALPLPCGTYTTEPICGRPLGMKFHNNDNVLYLTDAYYGIFRYDPQRHRLERLASDFMNMYFPNGSTGDSTGVTFNDIAITSNGIVYFTVSSSKFGLRDLIYDLLEHQGNGLIARYDPKLDQTSIIATDLYFPNGIVVSPDEKFLYFSELGKARILRIPLEPLESQLQTHQKKTNTKANKKTIDYGSFNNLLEIVVDNLPALPDNLAWVTPTELWVVGSNPRVDYNGSLALSTTNPSSSSKSLIQSILSSFKFPLYDLIGPYPWIRKLVSKIIPPSMQGLLLDTQRSGIMRIDVEKQQVIELMTTSPDHDNHQVAGLAHSMASITPHNPGNLPDGHIHIYIGGFHPDVASIGRLVWDTHNQRPVISVKQQNREKRREELRKLRQEQVNDEL